MSTYPTLPAPPVRVPIRATFAIGGMTCSACSGAIGRALTGADGISNAVVNLLSSSLTLQISGSHLVEMVIRRVEEIGYECTLVKLDNATTHDSLLSHESDRLTEKRSVSLSIEPANCS